MGVPNSKPFRVSDGEGRSYQFGQRSSQGKGGKRRACPEPYAICTFVSRLLCHYPLARRRNPSAVRNHSWEGGRTLSGCFAGLLLLSSLSSLVVVVVEAVVEVVVVVVVVVVAVVVVVVVVTSSIITSIVNITISNITITAYCNHYNYN